MNKQEQQYQIRKQEQQDTQQADTWIKQQGLNTGTFGITNLQLLQAQQTAHTLLTAHKHLLNQKQIQTLKALKQKNTNKVAADLEARAKKAKVKAKIKG